MRCLSLPVPAAVSKAFTCLSDPAKRRNYDTYGREDGAAANLGGGMGRRGGGGGGGGFYGGMEVDPEELFNMWVLAKHLVVLHCCSGILLAQAQLETALRTMRQEREAM